MKQDSQTLISAMKTSISDVLETMFFLPIDFPSQLPAGKLFDIQQDKILAVKLDFDGPIKGTSLLGLYRQKATAIAADFLGIETGSVTLEKATETVMEIINMIVGNTLSSYDQQAVFNLNIPEPFESDSFLREIHEPDNEMLIIIDTLGGHVAFKMLIDQC